MVLSQIPYLQPEGYRAGIVYYPKYQQAEQRGLPVQEEPPVKSGHITTLFTAHGKSNRMLTTQCFTARFQADTRNMITPYR